PTSYETTGRFCRKSRVDSRRRSTPARESPDPRKRTPAHLSRSQRRFLRAVETTQFPSRTQSAAGESSSSSTNANPSRPLPALSKTCVHVNQHDIKAPRYTQLARVLVHHSAKVKKNERVLIEAFKTPADFTAVLINTIVDAGGIPFASTY